MQKIKSCFVCTCISLLLFISCASQSGAGSNPRFWKSGSRVIGDMYILYSYSHAQRSAEALYSAVDFALKRVEKALDISFKDTEREDIVKRGYSSKYNVIVRRKEFVEQADGVECYLQMSLRLDFSNPRHRRFASEFAEHSKHLLSQYNNAISQFRSYEDTRAVNTLIACAYYSDRFDVNLDNMCSADFIARAYSMLKRIRVFLINTDDTEAKLRVCRRERGRLVPINMAGINASFESGSSYVYEFFTDSEGYVNTMPHFYDISESGVIRFSIMCEDREIIEANFSDKTLVNSFFSLLDSYNIQVYFEGKVIEDKIGFITSFQDTKGVELSTKTYDLQLMSLCANFKDFSKIDILISNLQSIEDIFSDPSLKGFRYVIATQSVVDNVVERADYSTIHMQGELYILDNKEKKIIHQNINIETVGKSTTTELAMQATVNDHYQKIAKICRNILFSYR